MRKMKQRKLGNSHVEVPPIGLGCMSMSGAYGSIVDKKDMISVIRGSVERGVTFFDTAQNCGRSLMKSLWAKRLLQPTLKKAAKPDHSKMATWSQDEVRRIAEADDFHISPFREDGVTYGTPTWIWSVAVDESLPNLFRPPRAFPEWIIVTLPRLRQSD
jgi:hypothetical protein